MRAEPAASVHPRWVPPQGTYAKVKYGQHAESGEAVAVKVLDKEQLVLSGMVEQIKREITILKQASAARAGRRWLTGAGAGAAVGQPWAFVSIRGLGGGLNG